MIQITLHELYKLFNREVIFRALNYNFEGGKTYAITGPNGSGKSTLLQVISGYMLASKGSIEYHTGQQKILDDDIYKHLSIATPYLELVEELTLSELLKFHFVFKRTRYNMPVGEVINACYLNGSERKFIKHFSSGMKQRLKLALAFYSDSKIVLLDEPTTNLDTKGIDWYQQQLTKLKNEKNTLLIIASNQQYEYEQSDQALDISDFK